MPTERVSALLALWESRWGRQRLRRLAVAAAMAVVLATVIFDAVDVLCGQHPAGWTARATMTGSLVSFLAVPRVR